MTALFPLLHKIGRVEKPLFIIMITMLNCFGIFLSIEGGWEGTMVDLFPSFYTLPFLFALSSPVVILYLCYYYTFRPQ
jgi:hypothetical protein